MVMPKFNSVDHAPWKLGILMCMGMNFWEKIQTGIPTSIATDIPTLAPRAVVRTVKIPKMNTAIVGAFSTPTMPVK